MRYRKTIVTLCCLFILPLMAAADGKLESSVFDNEQVSLKYNLSSGIGSEATVSNYQSEFQGSDELNDADYQEKSPFKAFLLSLAVPGLGQYYNGSKIKPFIFLGIEATCWIYNVKLNNDGDDITAEFEAFQRAHWSRTSYEDEYLMWVYGVNDDNLVDPSHVEISHHLPDTETQQYFEMTGKYNQFAWGWDDAELNGLTIDDYSSGNPMPPVAGDNVPTSANRLFYEQRRDDANTKYDQAKRMIMVAAFNHVISAFEALISANRINKRNGGGADDEFSSWKVNAQLKSYNAKRDTPFLNVAYSF